MKLLIVGSGGREDALAWACHRSSLKPDVTLSPGNGASSRFGKTAPIAADQIDQIVRLVKAEGFDLTVIGPEVPAVLGLADRLTEAGYPVFGPSAGAARIEGSKAFAKDIMLRAGIPTADFGVFSSLDGALDFLKGKSEPVVVKASGLAAGKGAVVCETLEEARSTCCSMLVEGELGEAGREVIIEEYLEGFEVSMTAIVDGLDYLLLPPSRDHKRIGDGDKGPNTGGMGAYSPLPDFSDSAYAEVARDLLPRLLGALAETGSPFRGVIYPGLMITKNGYRVLEFNARFGDPEAQVLLPLMDIDLLELMLETVSGNLSGWFSRNPEIFSDWRRAAKPGAASTVVAAAAGYPGKPAKGTPITSLPKESENIIPFFAGVKASPAGLATDGGRVLAITGLGANQDEAVARAYQGIDAVQFEGMHYRRDIGRSISG